MLRQGRARRRMFWNHGIAADFSIPIGLRAWFGLLCHATRCDSYFRNFQQNPGWKSEMASESLAIPNGRKSPSGCGTGVT